MAIGGGISLNRDLSFGSLGIWGCLERLDFFSKNLLFLYIFKQILNENSVNVVKYKWFFDTDYFRKLEQEIK